MTSLVETGFDCTVSGVTGLEKPLQKIQNTTGTILALSSSYIDGVLESYVQKLADFIKEIVGESPAIALESYMHNNNEYIAMYAKGTAGDFPVIFIIGASCNFPDLDAAGIDIWVDRTIDALCMVRLVTIAVCGNAKVALI